MLSSPVTRSAATRDWLLPWLDQVGVDWRKTPLWPQSPLAGGRVANWLQAPICSVPRPPRGTGLRFLACSFGNGEKGREGGGHRGETRDRGGTRGNLECFGVRVPLLLLSVPAGLGAPQVQDLLGEIHLQDVPL